jgi:hypothetical protein
VQLNRIDQQIGESKMLSKYPSAAVRHFNMWKLFSYKCLRLGVVQAWTTPQPSADRRYTLPGTLIRTLKYHSQPNSTFQKYHSTLLRLFLDTVSRRLVNKRGATTPQTPGIRRDRFWLPLGENRAPQFSR